MSTKHMQRDRTARRVLGIIMIAVIGVIQAVGTILVGAGGIVLKAVSVLIEYSCQSGNCSDIIRILFRHYPDAKAADIDTVW